MCRASKSLCLSERYFVGGFLRLLFFGRNQRRRRFLALGKNGGATGARLFFRGGDCGFAVRLALFDRLALHSVRARFRLQHNALALLKRVFALFLGKRLGVRYLFQNLFYHCSLT